MRACRDFDPDTALVISTREELTVGVSEGSDLENEAPLGGGNGGRGNGGGKRNGRKRAPEEVSSSIATEVEDDVKRPNRDRNRTARNKTLRHLLEGLRALDNGDFRARLTANGDPLMAEIVDVFNSVAGRHERLAEELRRVSFAVGREGNMRERVVFAASGSWNIAADAVNNMITDLVQPTTEVS